MQPGKATARAVQLSSFLLVGSFSWGFCYQDICQYDSMWSNNEHRSLEKGENSWKWHTDSITKFTYHKKMGSMFVAFWCIVELGGRWPLSGLEITHVSRFHFDAIKPVSGIRHSCRLLTRARLNHGCTVLTLREYKMHFFIQCGFSQPYCKLTTHTIYHRSILLIPNLRWLIWSYWYSSTWQSHDRNGRNSNPVFRIG